MQISWISAFDVYNVVGYIKFGNDVTHIPISMSTSLRWLSAGDNDTNLFQEIIWFEENFNLIQKRKTDEN